jgi:hypothetical protein
LFGKCVPIGGCLTGAARIKNAVQVIFQILLKKNEFEPHVWNAIKNLLRGLVELLPLTGIFLIIYDAVRNSVVFYTKSIKEIIEKENILGVAIDGKLIFTITTDQLDEFFVNKGGNLDFYKDKPNTEALRFETFKELCLGFVKAGEKKDPKMSMAALFHNVHNDLLRIN